MASSIDPSRPGAAPPDTLGLARRLWQAGRPDEARRTVAQALQRGDPDRRLRLAAWALQERFAAPLAGPRVTLARRGPADLPLVRAAWADRGFMERFHRLAPDLPAADEALRAILAREARATLLDSRNLHWTIRASRDGTPVGLASLVDISLQHGRAEYIVGMRDAAAGMALEATLLLLEFAFSVLRLRKIGATVYGGNEYALRCGDHLGFVREGLLRRHLRDPRSGALVDLCLLALFREQFVAPQNRRLARRLLRRDLQAGAGAAVPGGS